MEVWFGGLGVPSTAKNGDDLTFCMQNGRILPKIDILQSHYELVLNCIIDEQGNW